MFTAFFSTLSGYKNAIIICVVVAILAAYSVFVWRTATSVATNDFLREKSELQQKVADEVARRNEIASTIGSVIDQKLSNITVKNTTIVKEVQHEVDTHTFYATCVNTPSVVQHLNDATDSANKGISQQSSEVPPNP